MTCLQSHCRIQSQFRVLQGCRHNWRYMGKKIWKKEQHKDSPHLRLKDPSHQAPRYRVHKQKKHKCLKDSSNAIFEPTKMPLVSFKRRFLNRAWYVCSLFILWENYQNVKCTVISKHQIDCKAFEYLEGVWGLQLSQQQPKKDSILLVRKCKYLPELVSAHEAP